MTNLPAQFETLLERIAAALERLAPPPAPPVDLDAADAFVFFAEDNRLVPVPKVNRVALPLLQGVERVRDILLANKIGRASCRERV